jgi:transposase
MNNFIRNHKIKEGVPKVFDTLFLFVYLSEKDFKYSTLRKIIGLLGQPLTFLDYSLKISILTLQKNRKKAMAKIVFKTLSFNLSVLFPSNLLERIPSNHPVLIVNEIVDQLNIDSLLSKYKGGGTSAYHPRMLLKVLFYAYLRNLYSCRKIAKALQENIYFMWLSGYSTPDFRTINRFRG